LDDGDGRDLSQEQLELTLNDILALHGIETIHDKDSPQPAPTREDAHVIAKAVLNQPELAKKLYEIHRSNGDRCSCSQAKARPVRIKDLIKSDKDLNEYENEYELSVPEVPGNNWKKTMFENWCDFLGGMWLEMWCHDLIAPLTAEVHQGINCVRDNGRMFEVDVALVRGHRLYVISCTTDTTLQLCKSKLFEVTMRARQLGGDLARSALDSLLHKGNEKGSFVSQLQNDVDEIWDAPNKPRIFGLYDLKEWKEGNINSLRMWLDS
ncbi:MAG: hypothetical protein OIN84_21470, partial [Candidatus Methanoperedens sp.]|nr:hypothetical protein [Candidatus Methanoperedens sp.]